MHNNRQPLRTTFLVALSASPIAEFIPSDRRILERSRPTSWAGYLQYGLAHYLAIALLAGFVAPGWLWSWPFQIGAIASTLAHPILRWSNGQLGRDRKHPDNVGSFLRDQLVRLAVVFGAAILLADSGGAQVVAWVAVLRSRQDKLLSLLVVYTAVVFGGGTPIRRATKSLLANVPNESLEQLRNAGMHTGWLERFLILTALLRQSPSMAGLILTAKSIVRYPELSPSVLRSIF